MSDIWALVLQQLSATFVVSVLFHQHSSFKMSHYASCICAVAWHSTWELPNKSATELPNFINSILASAEDIHKSSTSYAVHRPVLSDQLMSSFQLWLSSKQIEWVRCYEEMFRSTDVRGLIVLWLVNVDTRPVFAFTGHCCHLQLMNYNKCHPNTQTQLCSPQSTQIFSIWGWKFPSRQCFFLRKLSDKKEYFPIS